MTKLIFCAIFIASLTACGSSTTYSVGVVNNTKHTPIKLKIQYPLADGMKRISFSMIDVGEFKSNLLDTKHQPVPNKAKVSWVNSAGQPRASVVDLSQLTISDEESAIMFKLNEDEVVVEYLNQEQFAAEWEQRLIRKGLQE